MKKRIILITLSVLLVFGCTTAFIAYKQIFGKGVDLHGEKEWVLYLNNDVTYDVFMDSLNNKNILLYENTFKYISKYKSLDKNIKSGRYIVKNGMSNNSLVNMFRAGLQSPVKITFNNVRIKSDFAEVISKNMLFTKDEILETLNDQSVAEKYGFSTENIMCMFIPNTYEIYWNTSVNEFIGKMYREYESFWTDERMAKAKTANLSPIEVSILASIVESETAKKDEMSMVAGLYINRLKRGMLLQADPTVKFALQKFELKRILFKHLEIDSPYNTYKYKGLPPGPICLPEPSTIDAVLNYNHHDYIYMCAKADFSGYHNFAINSEQHARNAKEYQNAFRLWSKKQNEKNNN